MSGHALLMRLVIGYTVVGAFVFTVVVTLLALMGWVKLPDRKQQKYLFYAVIGEIVVLCLGQFTGVLQFDPGPVHERINAEAKYQAAQYQAAQYQAALNILDQVPGGTNIKHPAGRANDRAELQRIVATLKKLELGDELTLIVDKLKTSVEEAPTWHEGPSYNMVETQRIRDLIGELRNGLLLKGAQPIRNNRKDG